jgi:hypothetical protein
MKYIMIDGKKHLWADILKLRREQRAAHRKAQQPPLFEMKTDCRPITQRNAADRYLEPSLFQ